MPGWLEYSKQNTCNFYTPEVQKYTYIYIYVSVAVPQIGRHMNQQTAELQEASGTSVSFSVGIQMPTSSRAMRKKPCIAAKTTSTSSRQTFRYVAHSGVLSFASLHTQQHGPFCQSSCLRHHHQDVPGEAGGRHTRSRSSVSRHSPLCPFPNMGPMLNAQGSNSGSRGWLVLQGFVVGSILQTLFSPPEKT